MSDLYDSDALAWSERQAALLRQLADGQRANELIDWSNVIEEVQDVGLSELKSCRSLLRQALVRLLKLHVWSDSLDVPHWRGETSNVLIGARDRFSASMRQRLELDDLYADASGQVQHQAGGSALLPETCPFSIDDLLSTRPKIDILLGKFPDPDWVAPLPDAR